MEGFYENLVDLLDRDALKKLGQELCSQVDEDNEDRKGQVDMADEGLDTHSQDGGIQNNDPLDDSDIDLIVGAEMREAIVRAQGNLYSEFLPAEGPVKFKVIASGDESLHEVQERAAKFMNWQLKKLRFNNILDRAFNHLVTNGTVALKACWDYASNNLDIEMIPVQNLIVSPDTDSLKNSKRFAHMYLITKNEYMLNVDTGWFSYNENVIKQAGSGDDEDVIPGNTADGVDEYMNEEKDTGSTNMTFMDIYTSLDLMDSDGNRIDPYPEGMRRTESPYVITVDKDSTEVVCIKRNWNPNEQGLVEEARTPIQWIQEFRFFSQLNFYGRGFHFMIGGLDKANTEALRANLKAAALRLNPPRFMSGPMKGGRLKMSPGLVINSKKAGADDISSSIHEIQTMDPDQTMLALMGVMSDSIRRFTNTTDLQTGEIGNAGAAAATVLALIEKGEKSTTDIHRRVHADMDNFYSMLMELNYNYLPEEVPFTVAGESMVVYKEDFNPQTIDIIPTSDPNVSSNTQRIVQTNELVQLAIARPDILDIKKAFIQYLKAIGNTAPESMLIEQAPPPELPAALENEMLLNGQPVMRYETNDDIAHINIHAQFLSDPSLMDNAIGEEMKIAAIGHLREHVGGYYRKQIAASIGIPLVPGQPMDPQQMALVDMRTQQVIAASPLIAKLDAMQKNFGDPALTQLIQKAQIDMQIRQMEAQQELEINEQKALLDLRAQQEKISGEIDSMRLKAQTEASLEQQNHLLKLQQLETEHERKLDIEVRQAVEEERREWEALVAELKREWEQHRQEMEMEREEHALKMREENEKLAKKNEEMRIELNKKWYQAKNKNAGESE